MKRISLTSFGFGGALHRGAMFLAWTALWLGVALPVAQAHNLMQADTSLSYDAATLQMISQRAALGQPLFQPGDVVGVVLKSTPGPGTVTGVGGYMTFYIPPGTQVVGAQYVRPDPSTPGAYLPIPIKGQSIIAIGDGSIGAKSTPELIGFHYPTANYLGTNELPVSAAGLDRGTIAGVYADTGIFYSTDLRTVFGSWTNGPGYLSTHTLVNNRGLSIVPVTQWDGEQEIAYGLSSPARAIVDYVDERGNAPWGLANVVAGPQSGYAWDFSLTDYNANGGDGNKTPAMQAAINQIGPWQRIKYPGSQISSDKAGLISTTLGYAGLDASSIGYDLSAAPLPATVSWTDTSSPKAIRISEGELILGKPEFARVYLKLINPQGCFPMYSDAFGGDAGGEQGGKDHLWRYYNPTIQKLMPCAAIQKVVDKSVVAVGGNVVFAISFVNSGNVPYPNFSITDTLPSGLTFISASPAPSVVSGSALTWNFGTFNAYSNVTIYVTAKATGSGTLFNNVCATASGTSVGCSQESVTIGAISDLVYDKSVTPTTVAPGATVQYTLSVTNVGTGVNGTPLIISEMLPTGFAYASMSSVTLNGAVLSPSFYSVSAANPNKPLFTITSGIQPGKALVLVFNVLVGANVSTGTFCNEFSLNYESKTVGGNPLACVTVGGGKIGDTVYRDWNGNGTQDSGDAGISGLTVQLYRDVNNNGAYDAGTDTLLATTTTDANGQYLFSGLAPGNYVVRIPTPPYAINTGNPPGGAGNPINQGAATIVNPNDQVLTVDFGYQPTGTGIIGDTVFSDENNNGVQDGNEPGIPNVTVWLYADNNGNGVIDSGDLLIATTNSADGSTFFDPPTNSDPIPAGYYSFTGLDPSLKYIAKVDSSDADLNTFFGQAYSASTTNAFAVNTIPSDGAGGYLFDTADFGFFGITPGTIGDLVYLDVDKSGTYNTGDVPLPNVTVQLYLDANGDGVAEAGELFATTATDINGNYLFSDLGPGSYIVKVLSTDPDMPSSAVGTIPQFNVALNPGDNSLNNDFPYILILNKTVDKAYEAANGILTYTITPYYPGNTGLNTVQVIDSVPAGTTYVNPSATPAPISQPVNGGTGNVTWNLGSTLAAVNGSGATPGYTPTALTISTSAQMGDTYVNKAQATTWYGGGTDLITRPADANNVKAALIQFTLPTFNASDVIDRAFIRVMVKTAATANHTVTLRRMTTAWTEGTSAANGATWNDPNGTGTAGVWAASTFSASDYDSTVSYGSFSAPFVVGQTLEFDVTDLVRAWRAGTTANTGVAIISSGTDNIDLSFYSSEATTAATPGPRLVIGYSGTGNGAFTVLDQFGSVAYDNNNGTKQWAGGWIEVGDDGSPSKGNITITGGHLQIKDSKAVSIYRSANLAGATAATLSLNLVQNKLNEAQDVIKLQGSINGGSSWTDLGTYTKGTATGAKSYNLVSLLGSVNKDTRIRFIRISSKGPAQQIQIDDVQIGYTTPSGDTTTTQLSADTALLSGTRNVNVTMTVTSSAAAAVTPPASLTVATTGGTASASKVSGPTPSSGTADSDGVTFNYVYQVTSGSAIGSVKFSGQPTGPAGYTFGSATSQSVLTTPVLAFQAKVNSPTPSPGPISNTADLKTNSVRMVTSPPAVTATVASIGDRVWADLDGNGVQDSGEPGIPGVTVNVYLDANMDGVPDGAAVGTAVTGVNGIYHVEGLAAGNYLVRYDGATAPSGYYPTTAASQTVYGLAAGQQYVNADFGLRPPPSSGTGASIGDTVWIDANNNGVVDAGEAPIANVDVRLYADLNNNGIVDAGDALVATTTTDANGNYLFSNLNAGHYVVQVVTTDPDFPAGGLALVTGGNPVTVPPANGVWSVSPAAGQAILTADFGYNYSGAIGDTVFYDTDGNGTQSGPTETGVPGAAVLLYVDSNGDGIFEGGIDQQVGTAITATSGPNIGKYLFANLPPATYFVAVYNQSVVEPGCTVGCDYDMLSTSGTTIPGLGPIKTVVLGAGQTNLNADFGFIAAALVTGTVFADLNHDGAQELPGDSGIAGVTVYLYSIVNGVSTLVSTTTTDANGNYKFNPAPNINYVVTYNLTDPNIPSYLSDKTTTTRYEFYAQAGAEVYNLDFGRGYSGQIGGEVFTDLNPTGTKDVSDPPIANVPVALYIDNNNSGVVDAGDTPVASTTTDSSGNYLFTGLSNNTYVVQVQTNGLPSGTSLTPTVDPNLPKDSMAQVILPLGGSSLANSFGYPLNASAAGKVLNDSDNNNVFSAGDTAIPGVSVAIWTTASGGSVTPVTLVASTVTDGSGNYSFANLPPGNYVIIETNPTGYIDITDVAGANDNKIPITVAYNQNLTGENFLDKQTTGSNAKIGGKVLDDTTNPGVIDLPGVANPADLPLPAVLVGLYLDVNGNGVADPNELITSTNTDGTGSYLFSNLPAGNYIVQEINPPGGPTINVTTSQGAATNIITVNLVGTDSLANNFLLADVTLGSIGHYVFADANGDFQYTSGEGISGARVFVDLNNDGTWQSSEPTALTGSDGSYTISNLPLTNYTIRVVTSTLPAGLTINSVDPNGGGDSTAIAALTPAAPNNTAMNFGYIGTGSIGDRVFADFNGNGQFNAGEGLSGVLVQLTGNFSGAGVTTISTYTGTDGYYLFTSLRAPAAGVTYTVSVVTSTLPAGYTFNSVDPNGGNDSTSQATLTSASPANLLQDFGYIGAATLSGTVFDDANGLLGTPVNTVDGTGTSVGGLLYANLVNGSGVVQASVAVANNGTYSFNNLASGNYTVQVSVNQGTVGQPMPATALPANWVNTGENLGAGAGSDGTPDGLLAVTVALTSVNNANFGLDQLPDSGTATAASQVNPGGTTSVPVTASLFSGTDADGTVTSLRITSFPANAMSITINGTTYTSGTWPGGGVTVPANTSGQPTQAISVDPIDGAVSVVFSYAAIDNAGKEDPTPGSVTLPFTVPISGTVFDDANGSEVQDNGELGTALGGLYVNLLDAAGANVVATVGVSAVNGTYSFPSVTPNTTYVLQLTTVQGIPGQPAPATALPSGWVTTGENANGTPDSNPNSKLQVAVGTANATGQNFGIEQLPNTTDLSAAAQANPGGTTRVTVPTFSGTDPEDGALGSGSSFQITSLPATGTLYYNGTAVTLNQVITSCNPAFLTVDPNDGAVTVSFTYAAIDAAGKVDPTPASVTMPFTTLTISGTVWDDADGSANGTFSNIQNGSEAGTAGGGLYANLIGGDGKVIASVPVNANGTYSFPGLNGNQNNLSINLTTTQGTPGQTPPAASMFAGWDNTSPLTQTAFNLVTTSISAKDFGIEQLPTAQGTAVAGQVNPGGTASVTVPSANFVGTDPEGPVIAYVITALPANATTITISNTLVYTSVNFPSGGIVIPANSDGTLPASVVAIDPADGAVTVPILFKVEDAAGRFSNVATVNVPFGVITLSGTVWDDANGSANDGSGNSGFLGIWNSPEIGTNAGGLYAILVGSDGKEVANVAVSADGSYSFNPVAPNQTGVTIVLATSAGTVGQPAPTPVLPSGWANTSPLAQTAFNIGTTSIASKDFGIDELPDSDPKTSAAQANPGGTTQVQVPALSGNDQEDGPLGTGMTLTITSLAVNGTLYYDGSQVTLNQVITSYDPTKLTVDADNGAVTVTFTYAVHDAAGKVDPTPATVTMPFTYITLAGTVFDDANGSQVQNPGEVGTSAGGLYVNLIDSNDNVVATATVNANGTYTFANVPPNTTYELQLTTNPGTVGQPEPLTALPPNWVTTGENANGTPDGTPDSILLVAVGTTDVSGRNFGIEQLPNTQDLRLPAQANPGGTVKVTVPTLAGTDPEDGTLGSGSSFKVINLPGNGTLYYNGALVVAGQVITSYNPSLLTVDPNDGAVTVSFAYAAVDAAGRVDPTPATVVMPFTDITLAGTVFDDANGSQVQDDGELGTALAGLYVNLLDAAGVNVVATTAVSATDGTYSFINVPPNTTYTLQLTKNQGSVGQAAPAIELPAGWVTTGENANGTPDGAADSKLTVAVVTTDVAGQNFGIEQLPDSGTATAASQQNPGGTTSVAVTASLFSGTDPDGTVTSLRITAFPANATSITINGTTYTSGTWPSGGVTMPANTSGQSTQAISVDPIDGGVSVVISYAAIDNAGKEDPTPGSVTLPFLPSPTAATFAWLGAYVDQGQVWVTWQTYSESGLLGFDVGRSAAGAEEQLVTMDPVMADGRSMGYRYTIADSSARLPGEYTYRLVGYYDDGSAEELARVKVSLAADASVEVVRITGIEATGDGMRVRWVGGQPPYVLESSPSLGPDAAWNVVGPAEAGETEALVPPESDSGFFRVRTSAGQP